MSQKDQNPDRRRILVGAKFCVDRLGVPTRDNRQVEREVVVHPGAVVILPLLGDGRVVLIRNHRYAVAQTLWELPAGTLEPNEAPAVCAERELVEETGYRARSIQPLVRFYTSPGISDERIYAFVATGLSTAARSLGVTEQITVEVLEMDTVHELIDSGRIEDAKTLVTLLWYFGRRTPHDPSKLEPASEEGRCESTRSAGPIITHDEEYVGKIKIYNTGLKEDPVPGEKTGKGVQALNSSYWISDLAVFIAANIAVLETTLEIAYQLPDGEDFRYFINQANQLFMKAENEGLRTRDSRDYWMMASWLAMACAEVDTYGFSKYPRDQRRVMREEFYQKYRQAGQGVAADPTHLEDQPLLGKFFAHPARVDLLPKVALERLGIHNELVAIKLGAEAIQWKTDGFFISKRISSAKRHFDGVHQKDHSEDHVAHLIWNFMAIYHVLVIRPNLNDLPNYEEIRHQNLDHVTDFHRSRPTIGQGK